MIEINPSRWKTKPFRHQVEGVKKLVGHHAFALFDEMGVAKSKQIIDAACELYDAGEIDTVVLFCPAQVKSVWLDRDLGQIEQHVWIPSTIIDYSNKLRKIENGESLFPPAGLSWVIISLEYIRQENFWKSLVKRLRGRKFWCVIDESSAIKSHRAQQTKATLHVGERAARRTILNGTPIANSPLDLYAQFRFLDPDIIGCQNYFVFRARYGIMGGYLNKQVVGYQNLEELNQKIAPYILRRLKSDCLDLPPKLPSQIEVSLTPDTWKLYKSLRDDFIGYLGNQVCMIQVAAVKSIRLAQVTSGFLGGLEPVGENGIQYEDLTLDGWKGNRPESVPPKEISREKLDAVLKWVREHSDVERILIWCRFRSELERFERVLADELDKYRIFKIYGGQTKSEREAAIRQGATGTGKAITLGIPAAGGLGLNLTTYATVLYASQDFNLKTRLQSEDRCHRPGQTKPVSYIDVIATGPTGQKTIDHLVVKALRKKENVATWSSEQWRRAIEEEDW